MEVKVKDATVEFFGILNEESSEENIKKSLQTALQNSNNKKIFIDFSNVKRANSCGILSWYKIIDSFDAEFTYIKSPRWLVEQFNLSDFLNHKTFVQSIQAMFYCPKNDTHEIVSLQIGKEIPLLNDYDQFQIHLKNPKGLDLEMDFEPSEYFHFIIKNKEKFFGDLKK